MNEVLLKEIIQKVWKMDSFELFNKLLDEDLITEGTIKAEDMFNEDFLLKPRAALVNFLYKEETGEVLA